MATLTHPALSTPKKLVAGIVGGITGGIIFGAMMGAMGMLSMIAGLAGSQSALVGFLIHMLIASFIGATFALLFGSRITQYPSGLGWGAIYGAIWWVLGPLLIMPAMMGMPLFTINQISIISLLGHIMYGVAMGLAYTWYITRN